MIGLGVRTVKGNIKPPLSDKMLREFHSQWQLQPGSNRAKLKKMDGETFEIESDNWGNVEHVFELTVGKAENLVEPGPHKVPRCKVTYTS
jgi:hypothetical protein